MLIPYVLYTCKIFHQRKKQFNQINLKISGKYRTNSKSIGIFVFEQERKKFLVETCCHIHATCFPFMLQQLLNISCNFICLAVLEMLGVIDKNQKLGNLNPLNDMNSLLQLGYFGPVGIITW
jgi:hypothetical protein